MKHKAVFLDRDNTIIEDPGFIDDPDKVRLLPGAAAAIRRLRQAGFKVVVASNQSGVARGLFTEQTLAKINERLKELLDRENAGLDGVYCCPYLEGPEATVDEYRRASDLRKPAPGMLLQAAGELDIDLARSWAIGDAPRDVQAGRRAGCRTILIVDPRGHDPGNDADSDFTARSITEAVEVVSRESQNDGDPAAAGAAPNREANTEKVLLEIRDLLDRQHRDAQQDDFSLRRLAESLLLMLSVAVAAWGVVALFDAGHSAAVARLALAVFLQLAAISLMLTDRSR